MVLILLISFFFLQDTDPSLSVQYKKKIEKCISKTFSIDSAQFETLNFNRGEFKEIYSNGSLKGYLLISEVAACNLGGCPSYDKINNAKASEYFDLMVLLDKNKNILAIKVLNYFSDYGYEITSKRYLKKFKGKSICAFSSQTDGIDIISGATISSYALEGTLAILCDHFNQKTIHN